MQDSNVKYLNMLSKEYPTKQAVCREIINLNAILNLPKGTEHFMSDLHGEYEAFLHILNNCSGVVKEKVDLAFGDSLLCKEKGDICTLIYYPREKLKMLHKERELTDEWYKMTLNQLIEVARNLSSKYTRSKVRKAMPADFAYIIDELIHVQKDEDDNQVLYHKKILETILDLNNGDEFIVALAGLIKRLAVDHLHIVGDIFDRGANADKIMDLLMEHHSIDIEWGNHDVLWMGAAAGSMACIANLVRNNLKYKNIEILENGYGISLRNLVLFALETYDEKDPIQAAYKAMSVMLQKVEGAVIAANPDFGMEDRRLLHRVNWDDYTIELDGKTYELNTHDFPTIDPTNPYVLSPEEKKIMDDLVVDFTSGERIRRHVDFLYDKGGIYNIYNQNLLYHGCVPLDENGNFDTVMVDGTPVSGKAYFDAAEEVARRAFYMQSRDDLIRSRNKSRHDKDLDFMWYLWGGPKSPMCGRQVKTFERTYIDDKTTWEEPQDPYYKYHYEERYVRMILNEFGLFSDISHIINGHTPVKLGKGEVPVRANGKLYVIDGGFSKAYHKSTGHAGYTLIYNSHGLRLMSHNPFTGVEQALIHNDDIESESNMVEVEKTRVMVRDTDIGKGILEDIKDLEELLMCYRTGEINELD